MSNDVFIRFDGGWVQTRPEFCNLHDEHDSLWNNAMAVDGIVITDSEYNDIAFLNVDSIQDIQTIKRSEQWDANLQQMIPCINYIKIWEKPPVKLSWGFRVLEWIRKKSVLWKYRVRRIC